MEKNKLLLFCWLLLLGACSPSRLTPAKYSKWMKDEANGLLSVKENGDYRLSLQLRPVDYVAANEIANREMNVSAFSNLKKELSGMYYFTLRIASRDPAVRVLDIGNTSDRDINAKLNYFSFNMQSELKLVAGTDTIACGLYNFERNYELAPYLDFSLAFASKNKTVTDAENLQLIFNGEALGIGIIKFDYDKKVLRSIPQLSIAE